MASLNFDSFWDDLSRGQIDMDTDTFYLMLLNATGIAALNKKTNDRRNDVEANEVTATGYTAGGAACAVTVTKDTVNDQQEFDFGDVVFTITGNLTARGHVIYKRRGGASSADELVCAVDYGSDKSVSDGTFTARTTTGIVLQN